MDKNRRYRFLHYDTIVLATIVVVFVGVHLADFIRVYPESRQARLRYAENSMEYLQEEAVIRAHSTFNTFYAYSQIYAEYIYDPDSVYEFCRLLANSVEQIVGVGVVPSRNLYPGKNEILPVCVPSISKEPYNAYGFEFAEHLVAPYRKDSLELMPDGSVNFHVEPAEIEIDGIKHHVLRFGFPVTNKGKKLDATIAVVLSMDNLAEFLDKENRFKTGEFYIMSDEGNLIAHPDRNRIGQKIGNEILEKYGPAADSIMRISASSYKDCSVIDDDAEYLFWSIGRSDDYIWSMFYAVKTSEVLGPLSEDVGFIVISSLIGGMILLLVCSLNIKNASEKRAKDSSMGKELELAAKVQASLLSDPVVKSPNLAVATYLKPARVVGGDIYFYKELNGKLYFCIGDVSGKGVPAAFMMNRLVSLLHVFTHMSPSPSGILKSIDREVCRNNSQFHFVTLFLGVLDTDTGILTYCNAGHDHPLLFSPSQSSTYTFPAVNMPLGVQPGQVFIDNTAVLEPGSSILLYTDGVTEAMDDNQKLYGTARLLKVFSANVFCPPSNTVSAVIKDVETFASHQSDDITLLAIRYTGNNKQTL